MAPSRHDASVSGSYWWQWCNNGVGKFSLHTLGPLVSTEHISMPCHKAQIKWSTFIILKCLPQSTDMAPLGCCWKGDSHHGCRNCARLSCQYGPIISEEYFRHLVEFLPPGITVILKTKWTKPGCTKKHYLWVWVDSMYKTQKQVTACHFFLFGHYSTWGKLPFSTR